MRKRPEIPKHLQKKVARQLLERQKRAGVYEKGLVDSAKLFAAGSAYPVDVAEGVTQGALTPSASYKTAMMRPPVPSDYKIDPKTGKPAFKGKPPAVNPEYKGTSEYVGKKLGVDVTGPGGFAPQMLSLDPMAKIHALAALGKLGAGKLAGLGLGASVFGGLKKVDDAADVAKPIFTSPGAKATADISKETIPANKVKSQLEGRGVGKDEMEWTGFNEWIKTKKGEVSKAEIEEFFQQNQIQVQEVIKKEGNFEELREYNKYLSDMRQEYGTELTYEWPAEVQKKALELERRADYPTSPTKWQEWQLPGGENYRELLLIVPPKKVPWTKENVVPISTDEFLKIQDQQVGENLILGKNESDKFYWFQTPDGVKKIPKKEYKATDFLDGEDILVDRTITQEQALEEVLTRQPEPKPRYTGGHFEENDVVAHIRFNERVDPDGNKVLFIEEIQGDWAHKGEQVGFKTDEVKEILKKKELVEARMKEVWHERADLPWFEEMSDEGKKLYNENTKNMNLWSDRNGGMGDLRQDVGLTKAEKELGEKLLKEQEEIRIKYDPYNDKREVLNKEYDALEKERAALGAEYVSKGKGGSAPTVEPGPFVTDTHQWTNLALKRMIRWGSDNGFDSIAWVTGKQSADRYKVSKTVDSIYWDPETTNLVAIEKGGNKVVINQNVPKDKLADFIGKEPANRLLESPINKETVSKQFHDGLISTEERNYMFGSHSLEGADLDIGGEYHKLIYDQVLTAQAKKIGKKHGAKVEVGHADAEMARRGIKQGASENRWRITIGDKLDENAPVFDTLEEAKEYLLKTDPDDVPGTVWKMNLTDKLKQASRAGLPYYVALPPLVMGAAAQRSDAQKQQSKSDAQAILAN